MHESKIKTQLSAMFVASILAISVLVVSVSYISISMSIKNSDEKRIDFYDVNGNKIEDVLENVVANKQENETVKAIVSFNNKDNNHHLNDFEAIGAKILFDYQIINGIAIELPCNNLTKIPNIGDVEYVELDREYRIQYNENDAELDREYRTLLNDKVQLIDADPPTLQKYGYGDITGWGVTIAVIDTGIDPTHESLDDMDDNPATTDPKVIGWYDNVNHRTSAYDDQGHGTHCAGICAGTGGPSHTYRGVAPGAKLVGVKVMNSQGGGTESTMIDGLNWIINNKGKYNIRVISMSLGLPYYMAAMAGMPLNGKSTIDKAATAAVNAGLIFAVAAGNSGHMDVQGNRLIVTEPLKETIGPPATCEDVITVGSNFLSGSDTGVDFYSSRGPTSDGRTKPDVAAPGTDVMAPNVNTKTGYVRHSGTSMACPMVAGSAALVINYYLNATKGYENYYPQTTGGLPMPTNAQVKKLLGELTAIDLFPYSEPGKDNDTGWGLIDVSEAMNAINFLPIAKATANTTTAVAGETITFTAKDTTDINGPRSRAVYMWDFGDQYADPATNPNKDWYMNTSHKFTRGGTYTITLTITNIKEATYSEPDDFKKANTWDVGVSGINTKSIQITILNSPPVAVINKVNFASDIVPTNQQTSFDASQSYDNDTSTPNNPLQYKWAFGDGSSTDWASSPTAQHTYVTKGTYNVVLTVKDDADATATDTMTLKATSPPAAVPGPSQTVKTNEVVYFNGTGTDSDGSIAKYLWDFDGDGTYDWESTTTGKTTHTYQHKGAYDAAFKTIDDMGAETITKVKINIENTLPVPIVKITKSNVTYPGDTVRFDASSSYDTDTHTQQNPISFKWIFGDGATSTDAATNHIYQDNGIYNLTLQITDDDFGITIYRQNLTILNKKPIATIDENTRLTNITTANSGEEILFTSPSAYDPDTHTPSAPITYQWDFGDGNIGYGKNARHIFAHKGNYLINLTILDDDNESAEVNLTINITINNRKPAVDTANITQMANITEITSGQSISFTAPNATDIDTHASGNPIIYQWNFGDGCIEIGKEIAHTFAHGGNYNVVLTILDDDNESAEGNFTTNVIVNNRKPIVNVTDTTQIVSASETKSGQSIAFTAPNATDPDTNTSDNPVTYLWDFGDGSTSAEKTPNHTYNKSGFFNVTLKIIDDSNETVVKYIPIQILNTPPLVSNVSAPKAGDAGKGLSFAANCADADGAIVDYIWDFGDGTTEKGSEVTHVYKRGGAYTVTLIVTDNEGGVTNTTTTVNVSGTIGDVIGIPLDGVTLILFIVPIIVLVCVAVVYSRRRGKRKEKEAPEEEKPKETPESTKGTAATQMLGGVDGHNESLPLPGYPAGERQQTGYPAYGQTDAQAADAGWRPQHIPPAQPGYGSEEAIGRETQQAPVGPEGRKSVYDAYGQQLDARKSAKPAATATQTRCPKCRYSILVTSPERPIKVHCPKCGTVGILKQKPTQKTPVPEQRYETPPRKPALGTVQKQAERQHGYEQPPAKKSILDGMKKGPEGKPLVKKQSQTSTKNCPRCQTPIVITQSTRPLTITCPSCGLSCVLRKQKTL
ncbi:MAG: PKD domain-containing protein [Thermoplasmata archaeon]